MADEILFVDTGVFPYIELNENMILHTTENVLDEIEAWKSKERTKYDSLIRLRADEKRITEGIRQIEDTLSGKGFGDNLAAAIGLVYIITVDNKSVLFKFSQEMAEPLSLISSLLKRYSQNIRVEFQPKGVFFATQAKGIMPEAYAKGVYMDSIERFQEEFGYQIWLSSIEKNILDLGLSNLEAALSLQEDFKSGRHKICDNEPLPVEYAMLTTLTSKSVAWHTCRGLIGDGQENYNLNIYINKNEGTLIHNAKNYFTAQVEAIYGRKIEQIFSHPEKLNFEKNIEESIRDLLNQLPENGSADRDKAIAILQRNEPKYDADIDLVYCAHKKAEELGVSNTSANVTIRTADKDIFELNLFADRLRKWQNVPKSQTYWRKIKPVYCDLIKINH